MKNPNHVVANEIEQSAIEFIRAEISKTTPTNRHRFIEKFVLAALGSVPWVGGFLSAAAHYKAEEGAIQKGNLQIRWLEEHARKIQTLVQTLIDIEQRFQSLGPQIDERIQSTEYLALVRRAFRVWDHADSEEKRKYVGNIVSNAAGARLCSDDVLRLFIGWLDLYDETHLAVIREIYRKPGTTRLLIWQAMYGELSREDSAEADLFRLLIRDLSTSGVIRQERKTNHRGEFLRKKVPRRKEQISSTIESAFEDTKPYVLTGLGQQFVYYTMTEVTSRSAAEDNLETSV